MANIFNATIVTSDDPHYTLADGKRASVTLEGETFNYDPSGVNGPELLNFKDGQEDQARQAESDAAWAASCSPAKRLMANKQILISENQTEAGKQIAALFNTEYGTDALRNKEANMQMLAAKLIRKEAKGTATAEESAKLDEMESLLTKIDQIRDMENTKAAEINAALSQTELDEITTINWTK